MSQVQVIAERPVCLPPGFRASAVAAGLKASGAPDLALVSAEEAVPCAGVFTQSMVRAAPVRYCEERLQCGRARAVFTNAGIANAATGEAGMRATCDIAEAVGMILIADPDDVLVCSTGVIGQKLDMSAVRAHIAALVNALSSDGFEAAAQAIHTTDTRIKDVALRFAVAGTEVSLVGMCKGAAMIAPNMATMLAYLFTDAAVEPDALRTALARAVPDTFNSITVDSDTSTNDSVLLFANGKADHPPLTVASPDFPAFAEAVRAACDSLARQIVLDAEGATTFITVEVEGAATDEAARQVGLSVANSPLVKTAVFGADPNYGRLVMAVGKAGVPLVEADLCISCGAIPMLTDGELVDFDRDAATQYLQKSEVVFHIRVGRGPGMARVFTCDLTYDYVRLNAEYTT